MWPTLRSFHQHWCMRTIQSPITELAWWDTRWRTWEQTPEKHLEPQGDKHSRAKPIIQVWSHHYLKFTSSSRGKCNHWGRMAISPKTLKARENPRRTDIPATEQDSQLKRWCLISTGPLDSHRPGVAGSSVTTASTEHYIKLHSGRRGGPQTLFLPPGKQYWSIIGLIPISSSPCCPGIYIYFIFTSLSSIYF